MISNGYGLYIYHPSNYNTLVRNNLIDNINYNAFDNFGSNSWSFNYYSDYTGSDSNDDGIGDDTYYIAGDVGAKDLSPAMQPFLTPSITLSSPSSTSVSDATGDSRTFTATINQIANLTWLLDGTTLYSNTSVTIASYYNNSAQAGEHNLTVIAENANGTSQKKWTWNVIDTDSTPPTLNITSSTDGAIITTSSITISGTASDNIAVANVTVIGIPTTCTTSWNADITLADGANTITAIATDT